MKAWLLVLRMNSGLRAGSSKRYRSHSCTSVRGAPSTIHSAIALATPAECVTHTASATQKPDRSRCSPMIEKPSGVKEKMPLKPSSTLESPSEGSSSVLAAHPSAKSSSVNGSIDGIASSAVSLSSVVISTGIGRCP